jgi:aryl sulfotransferase
MTSHDGMPRKTRELHNHHMDSTVWNDFTFRDDDIVIGTYAKSGTTWTQQIVGQMLFGGVPRLPVHELSPWVDMRIMPRAEMLAGLAAQKHRRFMKTHLPLDALVVSPRAKYLYIVRDGRDVVWSLYNHFARATDEFYRVINDTPGRVGPPVSRPPEDIRRYFLEWLDGDGYPLWSFWENVRTWWAARHQPNLKLVHFADLKADLAGQMRTIADFLEIKVAPSRWQGVVDLCTFQAMKANADQAAPLGGVLWDGGATTFINKGTNGRWRDVLTVADSERYEAIARQQLGDDCAEWMFHGSAGAMRLAA